MDCVRWGDGIAIAGSTLIRSSSTASRPAGGESPSQWEPAYWILVLDSNGQIKFEEVVPTGYERSIEGSRAGFTLLPTGSDLAVSAQTGADTELLRLNPSNGSRVQEHYANTFLSFVRPVVPDGGLQLLGTLLGTDDSTPPKAHFSVALITLNERLEEIRRQTLPKKMIPNVTYRMPDQSLVIFGADVHQVGEQYTSQVFHVDASLSRVQSLNPPRANFSDTGQIYTSVPLDSTGRFAMATLAVVKGFPDHPAHVDASPGFLRGAALEFISAR